MIEPPKHLEVKLETRCETQAKVEVGRATGSYIHLHINDGEPNGVNPQLYELWGTKIVLLTSVEARQIGQKLLDFADHVDKYPDIRPEQRKGE